MIEGPTSTDQQVLRARVLRSLRANVTVQPIGVIVALVASVVVARSLGPALYAVVAAISALATTLVVLSDLGISASLPKILPEVSVEFGPAAATATLRRLGGIRMVAALGAVLLLAAVYATGAWSPVLLTRPWFVPLVAALTVLGAQVSMYRLSGVAAFRTDEVLTITLVSMIVGPVLVLTAALISRDPYVVSAGWVGQNVILLGLMRRFRRYDMGPSTGGERSTPLRLRSLLRRYLAYVTVTYGVFVYNRLIVGLPLVLWLLTVGGADAGDIGNAALAVTIVLQAWTVAGMPLASVRHPLIARLQAEGRFEQLMRAERMVAALLVLTSLTLAVGLFAIGEAVLGTLYGPQYTDAVRWGVVAGTLGLFSHVFTLGSSMLHQTNRFKPLIVGLAVSAGAIVAGAAAAGLGLPDDAYPIAIVSTFVAAKAVFWLTTDLWTDGTVMGWQSTSMKLRGVAAGLLACMVTMLLRDYTGLHVLGAGFIACASFLVVFRVTGGIGSSARRDVRGVAPARLKRWVALI